LITGIGLTLILTAVPWFAVRTWQTGVIKAMVFSTLYCGLLVGLEHKKLSKSATQLIQDIRRLSN
ncbi:MAG TPA: hypothetical protein VMY18_03015, partial [Acidobacteriota bacterium]|nr:hypothetical protein [Acidobacteriota bacterium]